MKNINVRPRLSAKYNNSLIVLMRHGPRIDKHQNNTYKNNFIKNNPHITNYGKYQCLSTGSDIAKLSNNKWVVITSPTIRTLQTTNFVCSNIPVKNHKVTVNNKLLGHAFYDSHPNSIIMPKYNDHISFTNDIEVSGNLPIPNESINDAYTRFSITLSQIISQFIFYREHNDVNLLIVGHKKMFDPFIGLTGLCKTYKKISSVKPCGYICINEIFDIVKTNNIKF